MRNLTMMTDLYQLTMMYGYLKTNKKDQVAVFDLFYRKNNRSSAYCIAAGLDQAIDYINKLSFSEENIEYLKSLKLFDQEFYDYLLNFKFRGEIYAVDEGTVVFPNEPIIRVKANIMEAQLIETTMLNIINHQTLIATKASRVCFAAGDDSSVLEFGLRRAQGPDAGIYGARAAVIGGCSGTSNVIAGEMFDVPVSGTHAHSWIMSFDTELEAFRNYAKIFPDKCVLLVDTYDTLKSGVPNAITVFKEMEEKGYKPLGIRLDSGDLSYLSKEARRLLDEAGFGYVKIVASSDLDEDLIWDLKAQGARIDLWGVGTALITSKDNPALGGVYKLVAEGKNEAINPKIKISENPFKITNPGYKKLIRFYNKNNNKAIADLLMLDDEELPNGEPYTIFDPVSTWKKMTVSNYYIRELLKPVFVDGECVYQKKNIKDIKKYAKEEILSLWNEYKRLKNPHVFKVDLSQKLYDVKQELLKKDY